MAIYSVKGKVVSEPNRQSLPGLRVEAHAKDLAIDDVLGSAVTNADGWFTIEFDTRVYREVIERRPDIFFKVYRGNKLLADTSGHVVWNVNRPADIIIEVRESGGGGDTGEGGGGNDAFEVRGLVTDDRGVAVRGVRVEALDHNLNGASFLAAEDTDPGGRYSILYRPPRGKARADLQVRVQGVESEVRYDAEPLEIFDLVIPTKNLPQSTEYQQLLAAIRPFLGRATLSTLPAESVNYVANKSGWDPRAVAMAAQAEKLAGSTRIPAAHHYALFRAGAPADEIGLSRLSTPFVERTLRLAVDRKLIPADANIDATVAAHREQSVQRLQEIRPAGAVSSFGQMLDLQLDATTKQKFIEQYQIHGDTPSALWAALAANGFSPERITALQTDGKLGFLTQHNAPLVRRLHEQFRIAEAADLVRAGLYKADAWTNVIGNDVPAGITREAYAKGLAAQVNLSFPTLVLSEMVRRNDLSASVAAGSSEEIARFFSAGHADHTIGVQPVKTWQGYAELSAAGQTGARIVERMYQMSPSNESMVTLSRLGFHSAFQIVSQSPKTFMKKFAAEFPSEREARMVYEKAQEVHSTTLNLAVNYVTARSSPNVYAITGLTQKAPSEAMNAILVDAAPAPPAPGAPTLEELFENMDYCACDHCKSVLSPAAYLVELLQFLDLDPGDLEGGQNPIDVLRGRRPDIEHLLLSCENTNIALPYVDIVNEILEFFIVNGSLATYTGHDMSEDSVSADLLADPQFVEDTAYDETKDEVFPWTLPFDMPLAGMRLILQTCDTTLAEALRLLGDHAGARRERLGLNDGEYSILTNLAFRALPVYFGLPPATTIDSLNAQVASGKTFSRLAAVSYEELVAILKTKFINPGVDLVGPLERLHVSLAQIQSFYDGVLSGAALLALLPADLDTAEYDNDVPTWLTDNRTLIMGLITLTDVGDPDDNVECNFAEVELRFALPDMNANRLTPLAYHRLLRFIRLWKKLGWKLDLVDDVIVTLLPMPPQDLTEANIDAAFTTLLARIANLIRLGEVMSTSTKKIPAWLGIGDPAAGVSVRRERLAALLRIGITDMIDLSEMSGIDPLATDMESDTPSLLRFIDRWRELKAIGLKVADLNYVLRHRDDSGKLTPSEASLLRGIKLLRDGLTTVDADMTIAPGNADLAFVKAKMALVYDNAVVNRFFSLIDGTRSYTAPFVTSEEVLPAPLIAVDARLSWDPFQKLLIYTGILTTAARTAIDTAADNLVLADMSVITTQPALNAFIADFKAATGLLFTAGSQDLTDLDSDYPELKIVYDAVEAAVDPAAKSAALINGILPALRAQLKTISLRGTLVALLPADPPVVDALTSGPSVLHANGDAAHAVLFDFERLQESVTFNSNQSYPFYLDPPATDDYILYVRAPQNTTVTLSLSGNVVIPSTLVGVSGEVKTNVQIRLVAGTLALAELTLAGLPAAQTATLSWRTKGMAQITVPSARIYAEARVIAARASLVRLQKAAMLRRLLSLTPRELVYFAASNVDTSGILNELDVDGTIAGPALIAQWGRAALLAWFAGLKQENEPDENTWVAILEDPGILTAQGDLLLLGVNGWNAADLTAMLGHFALAQANLSQLANLRTIKQAMDWVVASGYPATDLLSWSNALPGANVLAAAKATIRAKLEDLPWRETMKSVNDALRNQRRDALVAYILYHQKPAAGIDTADQLYEHFLIDVQMDACMQTSRIRAALSAIQMFIFRCFMNLEQNVAPAALRKDRWEYMKRYRVWEANRKVFLYPENWLEPELRDSKSSFFRELESELLKADITTELAEDAYLSYLKKLDDVARLEIVGYTIDQKDDGDPEDDVLHVFGRTMGDTRQYYYRRLDGGYWLPWEKVSLNIKGDHVFPMVWKGRLFVFWLNILEKAAGAQGATPKSMSEENWAYSATKTAEITLGWGEYYKGKWSSPKSSDLSDPIVLTGFSEIRPRRIIMAARTNVPSALMSERLIFQIRRAGFGFLVTFTSKNAPPLIQDGGTDAPIDVVWEFNDTLLREPQQPGVRWDANSLRAYKTTFDVGITQPPQAATPLVTEELLHKNDPLLSGFYVRPLMHPMENQWEAPFFYYDEHSIFFVSPSERVIYVRDHDGYFTDVVPQIPKHIPDLYYIPVPKPDPIGPVINPLDAIIHPGEDLVSGISPKAQVVLPLKSQFNYAGATFGAGGIQKAGL